MSQPPLQLVPDAAGSDSRQLPPVVLTVVLGIGYYIAARLSLLVQVQPENIAVFWPAAGLAAGALIALGPRARWPVATSVLLATFVANVGHGAAPLTGIVFGLCNALECLMVAALLEAMFGHPFQLDRLDRVIGFMLATLGATAVAALPAALYLANGLGVPVPVRRLWETWLESDAVGIVTVAPLLIALPAALRERLPWWRLLEAGALLLLIAATASYVFARLPTEASWTAVAPVAFLFPLLLWLAVRSTPAFAAAGALAVALTIVYCVTQGLGALGWRGAPLDQRVFVAQVAMLTMSFCTLTLAALVAVLRNASAAREASEQRLRMATSAARLGVFELHLAADHTVWENERMYELFAHTREDGTLSYADFRERYLDPADREKVDRALQQVIDTGASGVSCRIRRKDGITCDLDIVAVVNRDEEGRPSKVVGVMADVTERRQTEERQALLMGELDHRVKNTLDLVLRLLDSTYMSTATREEFAEVLRDRVDALARAHGLLRREGWSGVGLRELVGTLLEPHAGRRRLTIEGAPIRLNDRATQTFCLAFHELATNAAKYGALSNVTGHVTVSWQVEADSAAGGGAAAAGDRLIIIWRETGGPPVQPPTRKGFGSGLIRGSIEHEQQGRVAHEFVEDGVRCRIEVPLATITAAG